jgi:hypothetical protein
VAALFAEMNAALNDGKLRWTGTPRRGRVGVDEVVRAIVG